METQQQRILTQDEATHARFYALYYEHEQRLRRRVRYLVRDPELAEEVEQLTWIKAAAALPQMGREVNYSWLYRIATNTAYDLWRYQRRHLRHTAFSLDVAPEEFDEQAERWQAGAALLAQGEEDDPAAVLVAREDTRADEALLCDLLDDFTEAECEIVLSQNAYGQAEQVAARLGIATGSVYNQRNHLLKLLRRRVRYRASATRWPRRRDRRGATRA